MPLRLEIVPDKAVGVWREKTLAAASWFGPAVLRPHVYPFLGPEGHELTRLGHPLDLVSHSHHRSIWIGHHDLSGVNFWEEVPGCGRIEQVGAEVLAAEGEAVRVRLECLWKAADGKLIAVEDRDLVFTDLGGALALEIGIELRPGGKEAPLVLGDTPFGLLGIRVARTMSVAAGLGGAILNSNEGENEKGCHWQHADWCDYSGPVVAFPAAGGPPAAGAAPGPKEAPPPAITGPGLPAVMAGIACFNHAANGPEDTLWHVRDDGWMGPCVSKGRARTVPPDGSLKVRYRIEGHPGRPAEAAIAERYREWRRKAAR